MKTTNNLGLRCLALLMAVAMVIGLLPPMTVWAVPADTFQVKVTGTLNDEATQYAWTAEVIDADVYRAHWYFTDSTDAEGTECTTAAEAELLEVTVVTTDGRMLTISGGDLDQDSSTRAYTGSKTWQITGFPELKAYAGSVVSLPGSSGISYGAGSSYYTGTHKWEFSVSGEGVTDNVYGEAGEKVTLTAKLVQRSGETTDPFTVTREYTVEENKYTLTYQAEVEEGTTKWFPDVINSLVTATLTYNAPLAEKPAYELFGLSWVQGEVASGRNQNQINKNIYTLELATYAGTVGKLATVSYGTGADQKSFTVGVDTTVPEVKVLRTYYYTADGARYTAVEFEITNLDEIYSGVATVTVNGDAVAVTANGHYSVSVPGELTKVPVEVTSVVGHIGTAETGTPENEKFQVELKPVVDDALTVGTTSYDPDAYVEIKVTLPEGFKLDNAQTKVAGIDGTAGFITVDNLLWTAKVKPANGLLSEIKVTPAATAADDKVAYGKEVAYTDATITAFAKDDGNPSVESFDEKPTGKVEGTYTNAPVSYEVKVKDVLLNAGASYITYTYNNNLEAEKVYLNTDGTATIQLTNGRTISKVTLHAEDLLGNKLDKEWTVASGAIKGYTVETGAPEVKSVSVTGINSFKKIGGKYYAIFDENAGGTVKVTAVVADTGVGLDTKGLNGNFTVKDGEYTITASATVEKNDLGTLKVKFPVTDKLGNSAQKTDVKVAVAAKQGEMSSTMDLNFVEENGICYYEGTLYLDRRAPEDRGASLEDAIKVTLTPSVEPVTIGSIDNHYPTEGKPLTFDLQVADNGDDAAGIDKVLATLTGGGMSNFEDREIALDAEGKGTIRIGSLSGVEYHNMTLTVKLTDKVGNAYSFQKKISVDNTTPLIRLSYNDVTPQNGNFYQDERTITVTVYELNFNEEDMQILTGGTPGKWKHNGSNHSITYTFDADGEYDFVANYTDLAGNVAEEKSAEPFVIDLTDPEVWVTKIKNGTECVYTVHLKETNPLDEGYTITYTYEDADGVSQQGTAKPAEGKARQGAAMVIGTFAIPDQGVLTKLEVNVQDKAGNKALSNNDKSVLSLTAEGDKLVWPHSDNEDSQNQKQDQQNDNIAPTVTLTKTPVEATNIVDDREYYNGEVTFTLVVEDRFPINTANLSFVPNWKDVEGETTCTFEETQPDANTYRYTAEFTVTDGQALEGIDIKVADNSGNKPGSEDVSENLTGESGLFDYNGKPVIVDTTAPTAVISFDEDVVKFYYTFGGKTFLKLKNPSDDATINVEMYVTIKDNNLKVGEGIIKGTEAPDGSFGENPDDWNNPDNQVTFTQSIDIEVEEFVVVPFHLLIKDLAGNPLESATFAPIEGTVPGNDTITVSDEGELKANVILDRKKAIFDGFEPEDIWVKLPDNAGVTTVNAAGDSIPLYNGNSELVFQTQVSDMPKDTSAGLDLVTWHFEDGLENQYIAKNAEGDEGCLDYDLYEDQKFTYTTGLFDIKLETKGVNETNEAKLVITAEDNVGNTITHVEYFAVDNKAPEVTLTYDPVENENASEDKYFSDDRTITVNVTDLNLDTNLVNIITGEKEDGYQGKDPNSTEDVAGSYTVSYVYDEDGEYKFEMTCKDPAGNVSPIDYSTGKAPQEFIIDKTAPVVKVEVTPDEASKTVTYTVTQNEKYPLKAVYSYTKIDSDGSEVSESITDDAAEPWTFTLVDGEELISFEAVVRDRAGHYAVPAEDTELGLTAKNGGEKLSWEPKDQDDDIQQIDFSAPTVTLTRSEATPANTVEEFATDYYNKPVTYILTVVDTFEIKHPLELNLLWQGAAEMETIELEPILPDEDSKQEGKHQKVYTYAAEFTVEDTGVSAELGKALEGFSFQIKDRHGNVTKVLDTTDATAIHETAVALDEEDTFHYNGRKVVVDTTAPTAEIEFTAEELESYYIHEGVVYLKLKDEVRAAETPKVSVKMTISVFDKNLLVGNGLTVIDADHVDVTEQDWNRNFAIRFEKTITAANNDSGQYIFELQVADLAKNPLVAKGLSFDDKLTDEPETVQAQLVPESGGKLTGSATLDRRAPSSDENNSGDPVFVATPETTDPIVIIDRVNGTETFKVYSKIFGYDVPIFDGKDTTTAGLKTMGWSFEDLNAVIKATEDTEAFPLVTYGAAYDNVQMQFADGLIHGETNDAAFIVTAVDNVGNEHTHRVPFGLDNLAPRIELSYDNDDNTRAVEDIYFDADRTATVKVDDINFSGDAEHTVVKINFVSADGTVTKVLTVEDPENAWSSNDWLSNDWTPAKEKSYTTDLLFSEEGHYTIETLTSTDKLGNLGADVDDQGVESYDFHVDKTNPKFTVTKTVEEGKSLIQNANSMDYHNGVVTYTIKVEDYNLHAASFTYTKINALGETMEPVTETLVSGEEKQIVINDGEILTGITMTAQDKAGRYASERADLVSNDHEYTYDEETHTWVWTEDDKTHQVAVDKTPAVVELLKTGAETFVQNFSDHDYYTGELTYTIRISDRFLTLREAEIMLSAFVQEELAGTTIDIDRDLELKEAEGSTEAWRIYTTQPLVIQDGQALDAMSIMVYDNADNITTDIITDDAREHFALEGDVNQRDSFAAVVDMTVPTATIEITGDVHSYYTNDVNPDVIYVRLNEPTMGDSGVPSDLPDKTVELVITTTDRNLTLMSNDKEFKVQDLKDAAHAKWTGEPAERNVTSTLTYRDSVTVPADQTGWIEFDLSIVDLAGHKLDPEVDITNVVHHEIFPGKDKFLVTENGEYSGRLSVDRRRSGSEWGDNLAPIIELTPSVVLPKKANNGNDLYNGAFHFGLIVNDGENDQVNSGLASVTWEIFDANGDNGAVKAYTYTGTLDNGSIQSLYGENSFTINVEPNGEAESNNVKVKVTAVDNVGNTTTYEHEFAMDTLAPRVLVDYNNDSVQNERYFKDDRIATITVEDINFDPSVTVITTEVAPSAWVETSPNVYKATCAYTRDGEYTFDMTCEDKAANQSEILYAPDTTAPNAFTIDKTAPVISVNYSVNPVGEDGSRVKYYDKEVGITVNIRETNFNAADVRADFQGRNNLGGWRGTENHSASTTFGEGNTYHFTINYTDLAGNPAVPYESETFSVDLHKPEIKITAGDITAEGLNMVQDDLVLQFTITDAQENLSDFNIKLTHLNNEFEPIVVSGAEYYELSGVGNRTEGRITLTNIAKEKLKDGIYKVEVYAKDYAAHQTDHPVVYFSLNRFGSTFMPGNQFTIDFLTASGDGVIYKKDVEQDLVIMEYNPNRVWQNGEHKEEGSNITVSVNGKAIILKKGVDFDMTVSERGTGDHKWYAYAYKIHRDIFFENDELVDGRYSILLYGEDEATNKNSNEANKDVEGNLSGKVSFVLDHKAPVITVLGLEDKAIQATNKQITIHVADSTPTGIEVYLNGTKVQLSASMVGLDNATVWLARNEDGDYILNIPESGDEWSLEIKALDEAGNAPLATQIGDILINSNLLILLLNNPLFVGGVLTLAAGLVAFLFYRKKKKEEKAAA